MTYRSNLICILPNHDSSDLREGSFHVEGICIKSAENPFNGSVGPNQRFVRDQS